MAIKTALAVAPENALMSAFVVFRDKLETSMLKAADMGYDGVELALLSRDQVDLKSVKKIMKETGLEIPMVSTGQIFADTGVNFTHPEKEKKGESPCRLSRTDGSGRRTGKPYKCRAPQGNPQ